MDCGLCLSLLSLESCLLWQCVLVCVVFFLLSASGLLCNFPALIHANIFSSAILGTLITCTLPLPSCVLVYPDSAHLLVFVAGQQARGIWVIDLGPTNCYPVRTSESSFLVKPVPPASNTSPVSPSTK